MIALALFAAHFFDLPSARLHVAALAVLASAGAVAAAARARRCSG